MNNCPFCNLKSELDLAAPMPTQSKLYDGKRASLLRRAWQTLQWLFPATLLLLIPKCPLCVAAYVALFTGIGISVSTARWIQILMLAFCFTALAHLVIRYWQRCQMKR